MTRSLHSLHVPNVPVSAYSHPHVRQAASRCIVGTRADTFYVVHSAFPNFLFFFLHRQLYSTDWSMADNQYTEATIKEQNYQV